MKIFMRFSHGPLIFIDCCACRNGSLLWQCTAYVDFYRYCSVWYGTMYLWIPFIITLAIVFIMSRMNVEAANTELKAKLIEGNR